MGAEVKAGNKHKWRNQAIRSEGIKRAEVKKSGARESIRKRGWKGRNSGCNYYYYYYYYYCYANTMAE